jgi:hypothetical protein
MVDMAPQLADDILLRAFIHRRRLLKMKTKMFDCVEMKHRGAERVMKRMEGMTLEEQLQYWQRGTEELRKLQKSLKS